MMGFRDTFAAILARVIPRRSRPADWTRGYTSSWGLVRGSLASCLARWHAYEASAVDREIIPNEDMLAPTEQGREHYLRVGISALTLITDAMILSGRTRMNRVLDLPCGGGRVTRHLVSFFPEAEICVHDIDVDKKAGVVEQFGVTPVEIPRDFQGRPKPDFDLIFVGSLFTHLDEAMFRDAFAYLADALMPDGILILTTHGRFAATKGRVHEIAKGRVPPVRSRSERLRALIHGEELCDETIGAIDGGYRQRGFGYTSYPEYTDFFRQTYGGSYATPSWLMGLAQEREDVMILGYRERGYADHQDVVMVQKLPD